MEDTLGFSNNADALHQRFQQVPNIYSMKPLGTHTRNKKRYTEQFMIALLLKSKDSKIIRPTLRKKYHE
jgi:hypothetical protein